MSITIPAELLAARGPTITVEAILADLLEAARVSRSRINIAFDTPLGRICIPWKLPVPPPHPPPCPPSPIRAAVLPALDERQAHALNRAAHSAAHDGWSLWGGRWRTYAERVALWSREPFLCWPNPFLPEEISW
ncbi:hypothetical protein [Nocardia salmonicida]|uniref:hypothetical protein n=1 Tax=Nocardia salmonicida TaxID=53431 RepID=UPI00378AAFC7